MSSLPFCLFRDGTLCMALPSDSGAHGNNRANLSSRPCPSQKSPLVLIDPLLSAIIHVDGGNPGTRASLTVRTWTTEERTRCADAARAWSPSDGTPPVKPLHAEDERIVIDDTFVRAVVRATIWKTPGDGENDALRLQDAVRGLCRLLRQHHDTSESHSRLNSSSVTEIKSDERDEAWRIFNVVARATGRHPMSSGKRHNPSNEPFLVGIVCCEPCGAGMGTGVVRTVDAMDLVAQPRPAGPTENTANGGTSINLLLLEANLEEAGANSQMWRALLAVVDFVYIAGRAATVGAAAQLMSTILHAGAAPATPHHFAGTCASHSAICPALLFSITDGAPIAEAVSRYPGRVQQLPKGDKGLRPLFNYLTSDASRNSLATCSGSVLQWILLLEHAWRCVSGTNGLTIEERIHAAVTAAADMFLGTAEGVLVAMRALEPFPPFSVSGAGAIGTVTTIPRALSVDDVFNIARRVAYWVFAADAAPCVMDSRRVARHATLRHEYCGCRYHAGRESLDAACQQGTKQLRERLDRYATRCAARVLRSKSVKSLEPSLENGGVSSGSSLAQMVEARAGSLKDFLSSPLIPHYGSIDRRGQDESLISQHDLSIASRKQRLTYFTVESPIIAPWALSAKGVALTEHLQESLLPSLLQMAKEQEEAFDVKIMSENEAREALRLMEDQSTELEQRWREAEKQLEHQQSALRESKRHGEALRARLNDAYKCLHEIVNTCVGYEEAHDGFKRKQEFRQKHGINEASDEIESEVRPLHYDDSEHLDLQTFPQVQKHEKDKSTHNNIKLGNSSPSLNDQELQRIILRDTTQQLNACHNVVIWLYENAQNMMNNLASECATSVANDSYQSSIHSVPIRAARTVSTTPQKPHQHNTQSSPNALKNDINTNAKHNHVPVATTLNSSRTHSRSSNAAQRPEYTPHTPPSPPSTSPLHISPSTAWRTSITSPDRTHAAVDAIADLQRHRHNTLDALEKLKKQYEKIEQKLNETEDECRRHVAAAEKWSAERQALENRLEELQHDASAAHDEGTRQVAQWQQAWRDTMSAAAAEAQQWLGPEGACSTEYTTDALPKVTPKEALRLAEDHLHSLFERVEKCARRDVEQRAAGHSSGFQQRYEETERQLVEERAESQRRNVAAAEERRALESRLEEMASDAQAAREGAAKQVAQWQQAWSDTMAAAVVEAHQWLSAEDRAVVESPVPSLSEGASPQEALRAGKAHLISLFAQIEEAVRRDAAKFAAIQQQRALSQSLDLQQRYEETQRQLAEERAESQRRNVAAAEERRALESHLEEMASDAQVAREGAAKQAAQWQQAWSDTMAAAVVEAHQWLSAEDRAVVESPVPSFSEGASPQEALRAGKAHLISLFAQIEEAVRRDAAKFAAIQQQRALSQSLDLQQRYEETQRQLAEERAESQRRNVAAAEERRALESRLEEMASDAQAAREGAAKQAAQWQQAWSDTMAAAVVEAHQWLSAEDRAVVESPVPSFSEGASPQEALRAGKAHLISLFAQIEEAVRRDAAKFAAIQQQRALSQSLDLQQRYEETERQLAEERAEAWRKSTAAAEKWSAERQALENRLEELQHDASAAHDEGTRQVAQWQQAWRDTMSAAAAEAQQWLGPEGACSTEYTTDALPKVTPKEALRLAEDHLHSLFERVEKCARRDVEQRAAGHSSGFQQRYEETERQLVEERAESQRRNVAAAEERRALESRLEEMASDAQAAREGAAKQVAQWQQAWSDTMAAAVVEAHQWLSAEDRAVVESPVPSLSEGASPQEALRAGKAHLISLFAQIEEAVRRDAAKFAAIQQQRALSQSLDLQQRYEETQRQLAEERAESQRRNVAAAEERRALESHLEEMASDAQVAREGAAKQAAQWQQAWSDTMAAAVVEAHQWLSAEDRAVVESPVPSFSEGASPQEALRAGKAHLISLFAQIEEAVRRDAAKFAAIQQQRALSQSLDLQQRYEETQRQLAEERAESQRRNVAAAEERRALESRLEEMASDAQAAREGAAKQAAQWQQAWSDTMAAAVVEAHQWLSAEDRAVVESPVPSFSEGASPQEALRAGKAHLISLFAQIEEAVRRDAAKFAAIQQQRALSQSLDLQQRYEETQRQLAEERAESQRRNVAAAEERRALESHLEEMASDAQAAREGAAKQAAQWQQAWSDTMAAAVVEAHQWLSAEDRAVVESPVPSFSEGASPQEALRAGKAHLISLFAQIEEAVRRDAAKFAAIQQQRALSQSLDLQQRYEETERQLAEERAEAWRKSTAAAEKWSAERQALENRLEELQHDASAAHDEGTRQVAQWQQAWRDTMSAAAAEAQQWLGPEGACSTEYTTDALPKVTPKEALRLAEDHLHSLFERVEKCARRDVEQRAAGHSSGFQQRYEETERQLVEERAESQRRNVAAAAERRALESRLEEMASDAQAAREGAAKQAAQWQQAWSDTMAAAVVEAHQWLSAEDRAVVESPVPSLSEGASPQEALRAGKAHLISLFAQIEEAVRRDAAKFAAIQQQRALSQSLDLQQRYEETERQLAEERAESQRRNVAAAEERRALESHLEEMASDAQAAREGAAKQAAQWQQAWSDTMAAAVVEAHQWLSAEDRAVVESPVPSFSEGASPQEALRAGKAHLISLFAQIEEAVRRDAAKFAAIQQQRALSQSLDLQQRYEETERQLAEERAEAWRKSTAAAEKWSAERQALENRLEELQHDASAAHDEGTRQVAQWQQAWRDTMSAAAAEAQQWLGPEGACSTEYTTDALPKVTPKEALRLAEDHLHSLFERVEKCARRDVEQRAAGHSSGFQQRYEETERQLVEERAESQRRNVAAAEERRALESRLEEMASDAQAAREGAAKQVAQWQQAWSDTMAAAVVEAHQWLSAEDRAVVESPVPSLSEGASPQEALRAGKAHLISLFAQIEEAVRRDAAKFAAIQQQRALSQSLDLQQRYEETQRQLAEERAESQRRNVAAAEERRALESRLEEMASDAQAAREGAAKQAAQWQQAWSDTMAAAVVEAHQWLSAEDRAVVESPVPSFSEGASPQEALRAGKAHLISLFAQIEEAVRRDAAKFAAIQQQRALIQSLDLQQRYEETERQLAEERAEAWRKSTAAAEKWSAERQALENRLEELQHDASAAHDEGTRQVAQWQKAWRDTMSAAAAEAQQWLGPEGACSTEYTTDALPKVTPKEALRLAEDHLHSLFERVEKCARRDVEQRATGHSSGLQQRYEETQRQLAEERAESQRRYVAAAEKWGAERQVLENRLEELQSDEAEVNERDSRDLNEWQQSWLGIVYAAAAEAQQWLGIDERKEVESTMASLHHVANPKEAILLAGSYVSSLISKVEENVRRNVENFAKTQQQRAFSHASELKLRCEETEQLLVEERAEAWRKHAAAAEKWSAERQALENRLEELQHDASAAHDEGTRQVAQWQKAWRDTMSAAAAEAQQWLGPEGACSTEYTTDALPKVTPKEALRLAEDHLHSLFERVEKCARRDVEQRAAGHSSGLQQRYEETERQLAEERAESQRRHAAAAAERRALESRLEEMASDAQAAREGAAKQAAQWQQAWSDTMAAAVVEAHQWLSAEDRAVVESPVPSLSEGASPQEALRAGKAHLISLFAQIEEAVRRDAAKFAAIQQQRALSQSLDLQQRYEETERQLAEERAEAWRKSTAAAEKWSAERQALENRLEELQHDASAAHDEGTRQVAQWQKAWRDTMSAAAAEAQQWLGPEGACSTEYTTDALPKVTPKEALRLAEDHLHSLFERVEKCARRDVEQRAAGHSSGLQQRYEETERQLVEERAESQRRYAAAAEERRALESRLEEMASDAQAAREGAAKQAAQWQQAWSDTMAAAVVEAHQWLSAEDRAVVESFVPSFSEGASPQEALRAGKAHLISLFAQIEEAVRRDAAKFAAIQQQRALSQSLDLQQRYEETERQLAEERAEAWRKSTAAAEKWSAERQALENRLEELQHDASAAHDEGTRQVAQWQKAWRDTMSAAAAEAQQWLGPEGACSTEYTTDALPKVTPKEALRLAEDHLHSLFERVEKCARRDVEQRAAGHSSGLQQRYEETERQLAEERAESQRRHAAAAAERRALESRLEEMASDAQAAREGAAKQAAQWQQAWSDTMAAAVVEAHQWLSAEDRAVVESFVPSFSEGASPQEALRAGKAHLISLFAQIEEAVRRDAAKFAAIQQQRALSQSLDLQQRYEETERQLAEERAEAWRKSTAAAEKWSAERQALENRLEELQHDASAAHDEGTRQVAQWQKAWRDTMSAAAAEAQQWLGPEGACSTEYTTDALPKVTPKEALRLAEDHLHSLFERVEKCARRDVEQRAAGHSSGLQQRYEETERQLAEERAESQRRHAAAAAERRALESRLEEMASDAQAAREGAAKQAAQWQQAWSDTMAAAVVEAHQWLSAEDRAVVESFVPSFSEGASPQEALRAGKAHLISLFAQIEEAVRRDAAKFAAIQQQRALIQSLDLQQRYEETQRQLAEERAEAWRKSTAAAEKWSAERQALENRLEELQHDASAAHDEGTRQVAQWQKAWRDTMSAAAAEAQQWLGPEGACSTEYTTDALPKVTPKEALRLAEDHLHSLFERVEKCARRDVEQRAAGHSSGLQQRYEETERQLAEERAESQRRYAAAAEERRALESRLEEMASDAQAAREGAAKQAAQWQQAWSDTMAAAVVEAHQWLGAEESSLINSSSEYLGDVQSPFAALYGARTQFRALFARVESAGRRVAECQAGVAYNEQARRFDTALREERRNAQNWSEEATRLSNSLGVLEASGRVLTSERDAAAGLLTRLHLSHSESLIAFDAAVSARVSLLLDTYCAFVSDVSAAQVAQWRKALDSTCELYFSSAPLWSDSLAAQGELMAQAFSARVLSRQRSGDDSAMLTVELRQKRRRVAELEELLRQKNVFTDALTDTVTRLHAVVNAQRELGMPVPAGVTYLPKSAEEFGALSSRNVRGADASNLAGAFYNSPSRLAKKEGTEAASPEETEPRALSWYLQSFAAIESTLEK